MVLETLRTGAPINIHNLTIEEPDLIINEGPFNPQHDISFETKTLIERSTFYQPQSPLQQDIVLRYLEMFPESLSVFLANRTLTGLSFENDILQILNARQVRALFPGKHPEEMLSNRDYFGIQGRIPTLIDQLQTKLPERGKWNAIIDSVNAKVFFPQSFESVVFSAPVKKDTLNMVKNRARRTDWLEYADFAASVRILFGSDLLNPISPEQWKNMRTELEDYRKGKDWEQYCHLAADMAVLSAENVTVAENGLELVMPKKKDFNQATPNLPEARRFQTKAHFKSSLRATEGSVAI